MEALEIKTIFTLVLFDFKIPVTETVIISWFVMAVLITASLILTKKFKEIPSGSQAIIEAAVEFLNNFSKKYFGTFSKFLGPYMGSLFLFLLLANIIPVLSPPEIKIFGHEFRPPFHVAPPTRDINVTAALAAISVTLVLVCGFAAKGVKGWFRHLFFPVPLMLPFNLLEYGTRLLSLSLRLFGNILGGYVIMRLIEGLIPVGIPMVFSLYFDFFDGMLQAVIFVFLTSLYISEAVTIHGE
ncbi:MAG: F0F1 ATP synthase subunit A [Treponema sp.]|nr:F0F1 ATP synthase subunit A [Treponema sp.]